MDISLVIIAIGVIVSVYDIIKKQAKEADRKERERRRRAPNQTRTQPRPKSRQGSFLDRLEQYVEEESTKYEKPHKPKKNKRVEEIKNSTQNTQQVYREERKPEVNRKDLPRVKYNQEIKTIEKKKKDKKNPFEVTKNPVINAVIASEILGKPKCKR